MIKQEFNTGYEPRPLQAFLHKELKRFNVLVCHRRFGKTIFTLNHLLAKALTNPLRNPQYAYFAPTYKQAKRIAWDPLKEYARHIPGFKENKQELTIMIQRTWLPDPDTIKILLIGSEDPDTVRGVYLDGAVFDEFAQCDPIIWGEVARPALSDRKGWAIFIGTPKGKNHFEKRYNDACENPNWFTCIFKASQTGIIDDEELAEIRDEIEEEEYMQEMECSFNAAIRGAYFAKKLNIIEEKGQIGAYPYDPGLPVDTFWDLGMDDSMSVWFRQRDRSGFRYIEYFEDNGLSIPEMCKIIKEKEYSYGRHVVPWDANVKEMTSGQTRINTFRKHLKNVEMQKRQAVEDRIQAARNIIPTSFFNRELTQKGLDSLMNYQKDWDSKLQIFKNKPKHDWTSHAADSFGYSALDRRESFFGDTKYDELPRQANLEYNELETA